MHRIDTPTAQKDKFGQGKNGFTGGNPQTGTLATKMDFLYFDAIQEEIVNVIESAGIELNKEKHDQLKFAIQQYVKKGQIKLNSAIDSDSQTEAATPSAVKKVNDSAVKKSGDAMTGDLTINGKSVLKTGDYGVGAQTGTSVQNLDEHLNSGFYGTNTAKIPNLPFTGGGSTSSLLVLPSESPYWKVEQLSVVNGRIPKIYYRTDTKNDGKQTWYEAITTANVGDYTHQFLGDLANKSLNDLTGTDAGNYFQGRNISATAENGYPIAQAGTLQVLRNGADGAGCCQIYTTYRSARQFIRNYRGGTQSWEPWVEFYTSANQELSNVIDKFTSGGIESRVYSHDKRFYLIVRDDGWVAMYNTLSKRLVWGFNDIGTLCEGNVPVERIPNLDQFVRDRSAPVGVPMPWPKSTPPAGWFECNGAPIDKNRFPKLAAAYPSGFLPDLRGEFIRGWDNGRGLDQSRGILSWQNHQLAAHRHVGGWGESLSSLNAENRQRTAPFGCTGETGNWVGATGNDNDNPLFYTNDGTNGSRTNPKGTTSWFDLNPNGLVGNETHPRNVAFMYIVKAE